MSSNEITHDFSLPQQSSRLAALDLARFLAMVLMIQGHTMYELAQPSVIDINVFPWDLWNYIRGITAPIFLMISGAVHVFANKRDARGILPIRTIGRRVRMGLALIVIGYTMLFPVQKIYDLVYIDYKYWQILFQVNILQLFGISLLLLTGVFLLTRRDDTLMKLSLIIAIGMTLLTPFVTTIHWFEYLPEFIAAYLSSEHGSIFTIFPFTAYLFYGAALGLWLKKIKPEKRTLWLKRFGVPIGLIFFFIGLPLQYISSEFLLNGIPNSLNMNSGMVFVRVGFVLSGISLCAFIYEKTRKYAAIYSFFSKKAIFIYLIHLFIIYGTPIFPGFAFFFGHTLNLGAGLAAVLIVELLTILLVFIIDFGLRRFPKFKELFRYSLTAYIIYLLFI